MTGKHSTRDVMSGLHQRKISRQLGQSNVTSHSSITRPGGLRRDRQSRKRDLQESKLTLRDETTTSALDIKPSPSATPIINDSRMDILSGNEHASITK